MFALQRKSKIKLIIGLFAFMAVLSAKLCVVQASQINFWKQLELVGTIVDDIEGKNIAVIENLKDSKQTVYSAGDKLPGGAIITKILANGILLEKDGSSHKLKLRHSLNKAGHSKTAYQRLSQNEWKINAKKMFPGLWDVAKSFKGIRMSRFRCPDGSEGIRLNEISADHLLKKIGFKKGDIVEKINGQRVKSINSLIDYLWKLDDQSDFVVSSGCKGKKRKLTYFITSDNLPPYSRQQIKQTAKKSGLMGIAVNVSW